MGSRSLALSLYRALLREARRMQQLDPAGLLLPREPVVGEIGSYNADALPSPTYAYHTLDELVPGLEFLPDQLPLSPRALRALIRKNFKANKHVGAEEAPASLDQAFAALRALPQQAYLGACSSSSSSDGVAVDVTASYTRQLHNQEGSWPLGPTQQPGMPHTSVFKYRVRVSNQRSCPIRVLGRGWRITNDDGRLEGSVELRADNGVVGQQPVIPPGGCFEYTSCAHLASADGASLPSGTMEGELLVDLYDGKGKGMTLERVQVPVQPFRLLPPPRRVPEVRQQ